MSRRKGIKAWLVTWDSPNRTIREEDRVAAVLSPSLRSATVAEYVERLYVNSLDPGDRIDYAKNRGSFPYKAQFGTLGGAPWDGLITCGHNPFLEAKKVGSLHVEVGKGGEERFVWEELPRPVVD